MKLPPGIAIVAETGDPATRLDHARGLVRSGRIALIRGWARHSELSSIVEAIGPVFEPVSLPPDKELGPTTRISETGRVTSATSWHHDQSFSEDPPDWSALYCENIGNESVPTYFCDGAALLSLLSDGMASFLSSLRARHAAEYVLTEAGQLAAMGGAVHPVVADVEGDVPALFVSPAAVECFDGWTLEESTCVLDYLFAMMNWPEITVGHHWEVGDLVLWPNRRYLHRALPLDAGSTPRRLSRVVGHW